MIRFMIFLLLLWFSLS